MAVLNKAGEGGAITSATLNITKIMVAIATAIGTITAASGALAPDPKTDKAPANAPVVDWAGFSQTNRTAIVVAVVASAALIVIADMISRSLASARAVGLVVTINPRRAEIHSAGNDPKGSILGIRQDAEPMMLFLEDGTTIVKWVKDSEVEFLGD